MARRTGGERRQERPAGVRLVGDDRALGQQRADGARDGLGAERAARAGSGRGVSPIADVRAGADRGGERLERRRRVVTAAGEHA